MKSCSVVSFSRNVTVSWEKCKTAMRIEGTLMGGHFLADRSIARPPHRSKYLPFVPTNLATWFDDQPANAKFRQGQPQSNDRATAALRPDRPLPLERADAGA